MHFDQYDYHIASHYLSALINGDESGLSDDESADLQAFVESLPGPGHWDCDDDEHFARCEVSGMMSSVVDCRYFVAIK